MLDIDDGSACQVGQNRRDPLRLSENDLQSNLLARADCG